MWIYSQSTGNLWDPGGNILTAGYSGYGEGKNNPAMQAVKNVGPIPRGRYYIGNAYDSDKVGKFALPLEPIDHDCLGRTYFRIHGDSRSDPGNASRGCVIAGRKERHIIADSFDKEFLVIE